MTHDEKLRQQYDEAVHGLSDLAGILKGVLEEFLTKESIAYGEITYRIKQYDSFVEKISRKSYRSPMSDVIDLCGLRIVYLYTGDLDKIIQILKREFEVSESEKKEAELSPDRFGYRSYHIVASIREEWLSAPQFRQFRGRKFEIQIRSILMNSWASISHQLFYKKDSTRELQRRLYRLSALMELADVEIDHLLALKGEGSTEPQGSDLQAIDEIQRILDLHVPDRIKSEYNILAKLHREMSDYGLSTAKLDEFLSSRLPLLRQIEKEVFADKETIDGVEARWMQVGIVRAVMYLTIDQYWRDEGMKYTKHFVDTMESYRATEELRPKNEEN
jgi:ppGpp synthetase/RelA/SpoT-type nucleotidyltranferase